MSVPQAELEVSFSARALEVVRRRPAESAIAFALVIGVALWVYIGVRSALIDMTIGNLRVLLDTEVAALDTWIREKQLNVERWAIDERVRADVFELTAARARTGDPRNACKLPARGRLLAHLDALLAPEGAPAVLLLDANGRLLATRDDAECGRLAGDATLRTLERVLAGASAFHAPGADGEPRSFAPAPVPPRPQRALVWFFAPVRDAANRPIAALAVGKYADERFSTVLASARLGETGEAYAFDAKGRLLSKSRFRAEIEDSGKLRPNVSEILHLRLTDLEADVTGQTLTRLVSAALAGRARSDGALDYGSVTDPYRNYLGHPVVGAWRWLAHYDFGVVVEVGESEAYAPLARLERAYIAILLAAGAALLFLFVALGRIVRLRRERDEAQRVGNYELIEEVGQGGMARVYRARHRLLKRPTAVKIIELKIANDEMLARFDREVRLASTLMHPNTVEVFDYGRTPQGQPFYAMEFLDGLTLHQLVERYGPMAAARTVHVLRGVAGSLSEAHGNGLVHRDIKPGNVMLCKRGGEFDVVKVLDFGLVKDTRAEITRDLTRALRVLGTPAYMAPERIENPGSADARSDLYALGAVGFFLLTGRAPYEGDNDLTLAYQVVHAPLPKLHAAAPSAPSELIALILDCLAKDPSARPQNATVLMETLDRLLVRTPWTRQDARLWWEQNNVATFAPTEWQAPRLEMEKV
jgi:serine/threonine-protein kinase